MKKFLPQLFTTVLIFLAVFAHAQNEVIDDVINPFYEEGGSGFDGSLTWLNEIVFQKDGKALIGGNFRSYNGHPASSLVRINPDGTIDPSFDTKVGFYVIYEDVPLVNSIVLQPDGKVIIGGLFDSYDGWPACGIIRLNPDGSRDNSFVIGTGFLVVMEGTGIFGGRVNSMAIQPDGKILVGGRFNNYNGNSVFPLIRLNPDGSLDNTFDIWTTGGTVSLLQLQPDGKVLVYGGGNLIRLNPDDSIDTTFDAGTLGGSVSVLRLQSDGKILLGGNLRNGLESNISLLRLNPDGSIDDGFADIDSLGTRDIALNPEGKIYTRGNFSWGNGTLFRFNPDGTRDSTFRAESVSTGEILAVQADGKLIADADYDATPDSKALLRYKEDGTLDRTFNPKEEPDADLPLTEVIRINSGGGDIDFEGEKWQADQYYTGGADHSSTGPIANTENDLLYQSERNGNVTYDIPLSEEGQYTVELHFAEIHWERPAARLFRVALEGEQVDSTIDLYGDHGGFRSSYVLKVEDLEVVDGKLTIELITEKDRAKISGIAVFRQNHTPEIEALRINSGGVALDFGGELWLEDQYFTGGSSNYVNAQGILHTTRDEMYRSERYGEFSYRLPATEDGLYTIELHFSEIHWGRPGARIFDVEVENGQFVVEDIDLFGLQGGRYSANFLVAENISVTDGWLDVKLTTKKDNAKLSGLVMFKQPAETIDNSLVARINTGGGNLSFGDGDWQADRYYSGGKTYTNASEGIGNTDKDELYHTERYGEFGYDIPVPATDLYTVELHFAEIHWNSEGARIFDVDVENGQYALEDLDLYRELGDSHLSAVYVGKDIHVVDGILNIDFSKVKDNPKVSGIVVYKQSTAGARLQAMDSLSKEADDEKPAKLLEGVDSEIILYPNPAKDRVSLEFYAEQTGEWDFVLVNSSGTTTHLAQLNLEIGEYLLEFDLSQYSLSPGTYYVQIMNRRGVLKTKRVIIL